MLPDIHRATQKFYIFLIVYLTGCTPRLSPCVICFFTSAFADLHGAFFSGGVRICSVCFIGHTGRDRGLHGGIKGSRKSVAEEAGFLPYVLLMTRCPTGLGGIHP